MSNIDESNILHSPEMNNNGNNKTTNTNQPDQQCFLERVANHICRHYNWIIVLMLTPISLSYDFYCFGKYMSFNWQQEAQANNIHELFIVHFNLYCLHFSKFLACQHILNFQDQPWRWGEKHPETDSWMEEDWNETANVFCTSIMEINIFTKFNLQRQIIQGIGLNNALFQSKLNRKKAIWISLTQI